MRMTECTERQHCLTYVCRQNGMVRYHLCDSKEQRLTCVTWLNVSVSIECKLLITILLTWAGKDLSIKGKVRELCLVRFLDSKIEKEKIERKKFFSLLSFCVLSIGESVFCESVNVLYLNCIHELFFFQLLCWVKTLKEKVYFVYWKSECVIFKLYSRIIFLSASWSVKYEYKISFVCGISRVSSLNC